MALDFLAFCNVLGDVRPIVLGRRWNSLVENRVAKFSYTRHQRIIRIVLQIAGYKLGLAKPGDFQKLFVAFVGKVIVDW